MTMSSDAKMIGFATGYVPETGTFYLKKDGQGNFPDPSNRILFASSVIAWDIKILDDLSKVYFGDINKGVKEFTENSGSYSQTYSFGTTEKIRRTAVSADGSIVAGALQNDIVIRGSFSQNISKEINYTFRNLLLL